MLQWTNHARADETDEPNETDETVTTKNIRTPLAGMRTFLYSLICERSEHLTDGH